MKGENEVTPPLLRPEDLQILENLSARQLMAAFDAVEASYTTDHTKQVKFTIMRPRIRDLINQNSKAILLDFLTQTLGNTGKNSKKFHVMQKILPKVSEQTDQAEMIVEEVVVYLKKSVAALPHLTLSPHEVKELETRLIHLKSDQLNEILDFAKYRYMMSSNLTIAGKTTTSRLVNNTFGFIFREAKHYIRKPTDVKIQEEPLKALQASLNGWMGDCDRGSWKFAIVAEFLASVSFLDLDLDLDRGIDIISYLPEKWRGQEERLVAEVVKLLNDIIARADRGEELKPVNSNSTAHPPQFT